MNTIIFALYAEGRTDERFLPLIIQRTAIDILIRRGKKIVYVADPAVLVLENPEPSSRAERILRAAQQASGYHALIVHADADHPTAYQAMKERIQPGFERVLTERDKNEVCRQLVPIIPIRMTEAWMLADIEALQEVIGTDLDAERLGISKKRNIESDTDPKQTIKEAVRNAEANSSPRRRRIKLASLYEPLAGRIRLERLQSLSAYRQFADDLTKTLAALHLVQKV